MTRDSVLICTYSAGYGHHKVSESIMEALQAQEPGLEVHIFDPLRLGRPWFSKIMVHSYLMILRSLPSVYRSLYQKAEHGGTGRTGLASDVFWKTVLNSAVFKKLDNYISEVRPAVIICTHPFAATVIKRWRIWCGDNAPPIIGVITDFTVHPFWAELGLDGYFVPCEELAERIAGQGVPREKVWVAGIPVSRRFLHSTSKSRGRRNLGLSPLKKTVLVMGGGLGLGELERVVLAVGQSELPVQMVVVTGVNCGLQERLAGVISGLRVPVKVFAFVENIPELMKISDVIITKPGGVTVAEALAAKLPILIWRPIPGQEERNASFLVNSRLATQVHEETELVATLHRLMTARTGEHLDMADLHRLAARKVAGIVTRTYMD